MTLFVRDLEGDYVNLAYAEVLLIDTDDDGQFVIVAHAASGGDWRIFRDRSRRKVEQMLNQLAARANGSDALPIDTDSPLALRRSLRFGQPQRTHR